MVSPCIIERLKKESRKFFDLPLEEKRRYAQAPDDMYYLFLLPLSLTKLNLWPSTLPDFRLQIFDLQSLLLMALLICPQGQWELLALEDGNVDELVDRQLQNYNSNEMMQLVACAASCVRYSARRSPRMAQMVRALEGDVSLDDLNEGMKPGHSV
ncbi:hypothetical protein SUGI_0561170 [Cryptomeria japonica]|nr:hypothetical protein SUGI_0561170 [Cryptomeria japonica]